MVMSHRVRIDALNCGGVKDASQTLGFGAMLYLLVAI